MAHTKFLTALLLLCGVLATPACNANGTAALPSGAADAQQAAPADNTSILKKLKKDVVIGTAVDPTNGDTGPRAITIVQTSAVLKKGQLLVCNFEDKSGTAGAGTTIDVFDPKPSSKPATFAQGSTIAGCDGDAISAANNVYGAGLKSGAVEEFNDKGKTQQGYGPPVEAPFNDLDAYCAHALYFPENIYVGDAKTGSIVKFDVNPSFSQQEIQIVTGFAVNKGSGWSVLGPSGLQYDDQPLGTKCVDTLYAVDGVDNTIIAISSASALTETDEIVVEKGGKKFKCKFKTSCAKVVYSGKPLDAPIASARLPNGNLVVANTQGGNTLVELTTAGKILDTKVVDTSKTAGIFGLAAAGTSDGNTTLFYTDTNTNTLHELEP
jgi:hypothetical protein